MPGGTIDARRFAITRCSTGGRGARTATFSTWVGVTWNLAGHVIEEITSVPHPDPSIAGAAHTGSLVGGANYPTCNNLTPYDNSFTCFSVPVHSEFGQYSVQTAVHIVNQAACSASNTSYCTYRATLTTP